eukprot:TRINITY_DN171_c0_g1_i1.p1 TRINITY_DN171_c0_g1~~TRINITY_DN171_c0_g1_i1.p1  ORF type:complete len:167 (-),score=19.19 TRINITY_DN171_c0_g1_i1:66-566(-)
MRMVHLDKNTLVRLQLWDIAGQERYRTMSRAYYRDSSGAIIVFDMSRFPTFEHVLSWREEIEQKVLFSDGKGVPVILLGNKCDMPKDDALPCPDDLEDFAEKHNFLAWFPTSAKNNVNIEDAMVMLIKKMIENQTMQEESNENKQASDLVIANPKSSPTGSPNDCC